MERNVILTTMSILPPVKKKNYYYDSDTSRYCEGIAQTEPGTKLLLSGDVRIDEIITIGSERTYSSTDDIAPVNVMDYYKEHGDETEDTDNMSAYAFFRSRICRFCANGDRPQADADLTPREAELQQLVREYMKAASPGNDEGMWLEIIANDERDEKKPDEKKHNKRIENLLRDNIHNTVDYSNYQSRESDFERIDYEGCDIEVLIDEIISGKTSTLEKEAGLRSLYDQINCIAPKSAEFYRGVLTEKINEMRDKRLEEETSYVKGYLFRLVPQTKRLMRNGGIDLSHLKIRFMPENIEKKGAKTDNIADIVDAIRGNADTVNLYVDTQGGFRTDTYARNAIISILTADTSKDFNLKKIIYTNFNPWYYSSAITDETKKYGITDLVAGMNAFIQYGRADIIRRYCENMYAKESHITNLVNEMVKIDKSLSICDINTFSQSLKRIRKFFPPYGCTTDPVFSLMEQLIGDDYKGIIDDNGKVDYVEMCQWALKKKFVQQALTIIESKFPYEIVRNGICYYDDDDNTPRYLHEQFVNSAEKYKFSNSAYYYINKCTSSSEEANRIRSAVGHNHIGSSKSERKMLGCYIKVKKMRHNINHAWLITNHEDISNTYNECIRLCKAFLNAYGRCMNEVKKKNKEFKIRIYSKKEIKEYKEIDQFEETKKHEDIGKCPTSGELESALPIDLDKTYSAYFIAAIASPQAGKVKNEIGRNMGLHTVSGYKNSLRSIEIDYLQMPAEDKNLQGFLKMIKEEADGKKETLSAPVVFVDEIFYRLAVRGDREDIFEGFEGCIFIGRDEQKEWHTVENL